MSDLPDGFLIPSAARSAVRRLKLRHKLMEAQASVTSILDCLNHGFDPDHDAGASCVESAVGLAERNGESAISDVTIDDVEGKDVREKELLEGADLILQFFNSLRVGFAQGLFSIGDEDNRRRAAGSAESKIGGGK